MTSAWAADWLIPDWPAPSRVKACVTTRAGGVSVSPYDTFNLGDHVEDDPAAVAENRRLLSDALGCKPAWLSQVHGVNVVDADPSKVHKADASVTSTPGIACAILTADCLPALFCDRAGTRVGAAHAGWRGLAAGVLEATVTKLGVAPGDVLVWLGPAIGPHVFEVGAEVHEAFVAHNPQTDAAFIKGEQPGKFIADIYKLARIRLEAIGVTAVYGGGFCTVSDERFYSYRRAARTGRFASLVWLEE